MKKQARKLYQILSRTIYHVKQLKREELLANGILPQEKAHRRMKEWADEMMVAVQVEVTTNSPDLSLPGIFVGNHMSYLDIPVLMTQAPLVFVAKKDIAHWPVFGNAMKSIGTVFVERESKSSRGNIASVVAPILLEKKQSMAIFPSGTTTLFEEKPWRWGAFRIAQELGVPIIPFRIHYRPERVVAYLLEDTFWPHLWKLLKQDKIEVTLEFHPPVYVKDPEKDAEKWRKWTQESKTVVGDPENKSAFRIDLASSLSHPAKSSESLPAFSR